MNDPDSSNLSRSWDAYWAGTGTTGAFSSGGVSHPAIDACWNTLFSDLDRRDAGYALLDIATGNGAVVERALAGPAGDSFRVTCVDISDAAIDNVVARFPGVTGIVADAREIPLDDAGFDLVTSQFGVEYAGLAAITEAARLVAPAGRLVMLLHTDTGSIHQECSDSLAAITALQEARFVPLARVFFDAGFNAVRGGDRAAYDDAGRKLAPAVQAAEQIISRFGEDVAGGTVAKLYADVGRIHERIQYFDADEVLQWITAMEAELDAYNARMASMMNAAIDRQTFDKICRQLEDDGFELQSADALRPAGEDMPLAWILIAMRSS